MKNDDLRKFSKNDLISLLLKQNEKLNRLGGEEDEDDSPEYYALGAEAERREKRRMFWKTMRGILSVITVIAAATVLVATLWAPVMRVYGTSMEPALKNGELLLGLKNVNLIDRGDIIAFYYNDKVLLKRAIALAGDKVAMDGDGNVFVNGSKVDEPYTSGQTLGDCDVEFPMTVEENSIFVLGDHRSVSLDSRSSDIGNIEYDRILGKIVFRIWPLNAFGGVR